MTIRMHIETKNLDTTINKLTKYTRALPKNGQAGILELAKFVRRSARARARRWRGFLQAGIQIQKINKNSLRVVSTVPYATIQEYGHKALGMPYPVIAYPLYGRLRAWARDKAPHLAKRKKGFLTIKGFTPHLRPAWEEARNRVDEIMNRAAEKAKNDANL